MNLLRIVAPTFVCGVVTDGVTVCKAAPIVRYMLGWTAARFRAYVSTMRWTVERCAGG